MKIGVAQIRCVPGDIAFNCGQIETYVELAKEMGCQAIIFPEMVDTGYDLSALQEVAASWEEGPSGSPFSITRCASRDSGIYLIAGLSERVMDDIYNTTAVFDPRGELVGKYRKTHLAAYPLFNEENFITPGDSLETVRVGEMSWGLIICYDVRFPEISRSLALHGAEVLALTSAFPFPRLNHWKTLLRARAIENQVYVIAANRVGTDSGVTFCGSSCIVDPYGVTVAEAAEDREELIVGEISREIVASVRGYMPVLKQRREDLC